MYNILPEETKKTLRREYTMRLVALVSWFIGAVILAGIILLIPSFVLTLQKKSELKNEIVANTKSSEEENAVDYAALAKELQEKLKVIPLLPTESHLPHVLLTAILNERGNAVTLNKYRYELIGSSTAVTLGGMAKTRDDLLTFKARLEKAKIFKTIDFPIELLVKTENINFTMTLK